MRSKLSLPSFVALCALACVLTFAGCRTNGDSTSHKIGTDVTDIPLGFLGLMFGSFFPESRGVMVASKPVGARVLIDGHDSGFVTPCCLAVDRKKQRIDLVLDGYQKASRIVTTDERTYLIYWDEAYLGPNSYRFPLWLNSFDGLVPVRFEEIFSPERIFVRMRASGTP
jgi:hypothetical protein